MSTIRITSVTFQKNVIVTTKVKDAITDKIVSPEVMFQVNHTQFWNWVEENSVEAFLFRPSDPQFHDLVKRRINKVKKQGFEVKPSENGYHYLYASR